MFESEIVEGTAKVHDPIDRSFLEQSEGLLDDAAPFDTAQDMLDANPDSGDIVVGCFLFHAELPSGRLLVGHDELDSGKFEAHES